MLSGYGFAQVSEESLLPTELQKVLTEDATPEPKAFRQEIRENLEKKGKILGIQELPMKKLMFVETERGSYVVSADGRFVFDGRVVDVWHRKTLRTLADAIAVQRTPVSNIGFEPEEQLAFFQVGNPELPRSGVVFVDPTSKHTPTVVQYFIENQEKYNFTIILMPLVGGPNAVDRAKRLWCAEDRNLALIDLANGTSQSFSKLKKDCEDDKVMMASVLTNIYQIKNLPHVIREDGLTLGGFPLDFDTWFKQP